LETIICFKHTRKVARDNTVKYRWRTLQILPEPGAPSYAGVTVEVQERLDGSIVLYCKGRVLSTREAPPRPGILRARDNSCARNVTTAPSIRDLAYAEASAADGCVQAILPQDPHALAPLGQGSSIKQKQHREPTPRQLARWEAIQAAMEQGLSMRAIARTLGISRNTVRKYVDTASPSACE
jgi:hypothetical protein